MLCFFGDEEAATTSGSASLVNGRDGMIETEHRNGQRHEGSESGGSTQ